MNSTPIPFRVEKDGPTHFAIDGDRVEITRSDQPICKVPLKDLLDFAARQPKQETAD